MQKLKQVAVLFLLCAIASCKPVPTPAPAPTPRAAEPPAPTSATAPFATPKGPFAVGTHEYFWVDENRGEPFTKDPGDKRHLLARIWYPAEKTGAETARYVVDANEFPKDSMFQQLASLKTNAVTDAPIAKGRERFAVLVYQPGAGVARFTATFLAEQLASHGYVVIAVDHPGAASSELFPDGYRFKADTLTAPKLTDPTSIADVRKFAYAQWEWFDRQVLPEWERDAVYTLDKVEELERTAGQMFHQRLDTSRIGMVGWSLGGALTLQMGREDARVKAIVNQDGQLLSDKSNLRMQGMARPFMLMLNTTPPLPPKPDDPQQQELMKELLALIKSWNDSLMQKSASDWYYLTIVGTGHTHFSDFTLFGPGDPKALDPRRAHEVITAYTLAFFDKYLRGKDSGLLEGPAASFPEVTFKKKS